MLLLLLHVHLPISYHILFLHCKPYPLDNHLSRYLKYEGEILLDRIVADCRSKEIVLSLEVVFRCVWLIPCYQKAGAGNIIDQVHQLQAALSRTDSCNIGVCQYSGSVQCGCPDHSFTSGHHHQSTLQNATAMDQVGVCQCTPKYFH